MLRDLYDLTILGRFLIPALAGLLLAAWFGAAGPGALAIAGAGILAGGLWGAIIRPRREPIKRIDKPVTTVETLLGALPDPILVLDAKRVVVAANGSAVHRFGRQTINVDLARTIRDPDTLQAVRDCLADRASRTVSYAQHVPIYRQYDIHIIGLPEDTGELAAAIMVMRDTTYERETDRMRVDFVANVSHELRSPLASLTGFIETLQELGDDDPKTRQRFLEIMSEEAARMRRLIDDLLSLAKVEASEHITPEGKVEIKDLLDGVMQALKSRAQERGASLELDCPDELKPVNGNADELTEVFENLVSNALKYNRPDTPVRITVRETPRISGTGLPGVAVAITDQGDGIEEEHIPRLTERFYRVDRDRSRAAGGTGLGLAIVKHILNRHRGQLKIESELGKGSTFTVYLPFHDRSRESAA